MVFGQFGAKRLNTKFCMTIFSTMIFQLFALQDNTGIKLPSIFIIMGRVRPRIYMCI